MIHDTNGGGSMELNLKWLKKNNLNEKKHTWANFSPSSKGCPFFNPRLQSGQCLNPLVFNSSWQLKHYCFTPYLKTIWSFIKIHQKEFEKNGKKKECQNKTESCTTIRFTNAHIALKSNIGNCVIYVGMEELLWYLPMVRDKLNTNLLDWNSIKGWIKYLNTTSIKTHKNMQTITLYKFY